MKSGCLALLILVLCYACRHDSDSHNDAQPPIYIKADNLKYPELQEADSLYSCFQTQAALQIYYKLALYKTNDSLALLATSRLSEIKHQSIFLYDKVVLSDSLSLKLGKDERHKLFYTNLRSKQLFDIQAMKKELEESQVITDRVIALLNLSICYHFQEKQLDSSWHYGRLAYDLVMQDKVFSQLHYQVFDFVQKLAKYRRNSYLSVGLMSDAISAMKQMENVDHLWLSNAYLQRSYAYLSSGEYDKAYSDGEKVKALEQENLCSVLYQSALVGDLYRLGFQKTEGKNIVDILKQVSKSCLMVRLNLNRNIGQYLSDGYEWPKSIAILEKANQFENESLFYSYAQQQSIIYMLSEMYEKSGQFEKALHVFRESIQVPIDSLMYSEYTSSQTDFILLERLASIYHSQYEVENDKLALEKCLRLLDRVEAEANRLLNKADESTARTFLYYQDLAYTKLATIHFEQYQKTNLDKHKTMCYEALSKKHGLILVTEILANQENGRVSKEIRSKRKILQKRQATLLSEVGDSNENLSEIQWALEDLSERVAGQSRDEEDLRIGDRKSVKALQLNLKDNQSLLNYYIAGDDLYISHLTREGHTLVKEEWTEVTKTLINKTIVLQASRAVAIGDYQDVAYRVFETLIGKALWRELKEEVVVVPHDILNFLSFDALVSLELPNKSLSESADLQYLIKDKAFESLPSEQLMQAGSRAEQTLLDASSRVAVFGYSDVETMTESNGYLPELAFSYLEAQKLKSTFPASEVFAGGRNSKEQFLETLTGNYDLLHVATHGVSQANDRYGVKLYFRGKDLGIDSLYGHELLDVDINAKLVVLSACQSGLGYLDSHTGTYFEGVYNLERYFLMQGAGQVVSALWDLDDQSTSVLMEHYYKSGAGSLRESKLKLIKENPQWGLPFYWAALN